MKNNKSAARVLSDKPFNDDTYKIVYTETSLKLNNIEKELVVSNWKKLLQRAQTKGVKQWDGIFYRMENIQDIISGSKELTFSTIKYSEVRALKDNHTLSKKFRADDISTASLIRTADGYFIFGVRNSNSMSKSKVDLIGGGLQKSELEVNNFSDIFKNELKEINEEVGLIEKDIRSIRGIGILQSKLSNVLFIFFTQLNRSKIEVERIFSKNIDDEMAQLEFVEKVRLNEYLKDKDDYRPLTAELYSKNLI